MIRPRDAERGDEPGGDLDRGEKIRAHHLLGETLHVVRDYLVKEDAVAPGKCEVEMTAGGAPGAGRRAKRGQIEIAKRGDTRHHGGSTGSKR